MKHIFAIFCASISICTGGDIDLKVIQPEELPFELKEKFDRFINIMNGDVDAHISTLYSDEYHDSVKSLKINRNFGSNLDYKRRPDSRFKLHKMYHLNSNCIIITYNCVGSVMSKNIPTAVWNYSDNKWSLGSHFIVADEILNYLRVVEKK